MCSLHTVYLPSLHCPLLWTTLSHSLPLPLGERDSRHDRDDVLLTVECYVVTKVTSLPADLDTTFQKLLLKSSDKGRGREGEKVGTREGSPNPATHKTSTIEGKKPKLTKAPASMISSSTGVAQLMEKRSCVFLDLPPFRVSFFCTHTPTNIGNIRYLSKKHLQWAYLDRPTTSGSGGVPLLLRFQRISSPSSFYTPSSRVCSRVCAERISMRMRINTCAHTHPRKTRGFTTKTNCAASASECFG